MDELQTLSALALAVAMAGLSWAVPLAGARWGLSGAGSRPLAGPAPVARRAVLPNPSFAYDERRFFDSDGAPADVVRRRRSGFARLASLYGQRFGRSVAMESMARAGPADSLFSQRERVPRAYGPYARKHLPIGSFVASTRGVMIHDLDGNAFYDLTGSCGMNVFGHDFYKGCIDEGIDQVRSLGPVLGSCHPYVLENVARLRRLSGQDTISFHMSGSEAVMQAVRLARYNTRRTHLVRFEKAEHGWWEEGHPGSGDPPSPRETLTLREIDDKTLKILRSRKDIACVIVNPMQALHPNAGAPQDSALLDSGRQAGFDRAAYTAWLQRLRATCTECGIVLIFDEILVGFRLARGGAQEYFGVRADMVTYGKTLGGGLPVGVVCGRADLMRRFREDRPADICLAHGTFDAHPYVMAAMKAFFDRLEAPPIAALYRGLDRCWDERADRFNRRLHAQGLPVRIANLSSIWTVLYSRPSRYNWMLQFYLRAHGLALSHRGTGRLLFSLDCSDADFEAVLQRFVAAAIEMDEDGWW
ncbi:MAG: aminotransferase class III-fold pyridoxal phosphate-dependent enzyme [Burkholderiaceae bacterium]|nr:aminotransferase class III-fold pyridoxal phosphate-dependent enzyme [Burkholderiaceae bacterium]